MRGAAIVTIVSIWATAAVAQPIVPDRELDIVRQNFNVGNYKEALARARSAMEVANFSEEQRTELHKFAGLSAFNLGDAPAAEKHFFALLNLNPDYVLDPFAYPPPAIKLFEEVKKKNAEALNLMRQQIALRQEQLKREAAEREKARVLAEEQRRLLEQRAQEMTVRTVEKRSLLLNFFPFGVGQFQQGRTGWAVLFATSEAVFALTSIVAWFVIEQLFSPITYTITDRIYPVTFTVRGIPEALKSSANNWTIVKYTAGTAFYVAFAAGVLDALIHHQEEVVSTEIQRLEGPPVVPKPALGPKFFIFPTTTGFGAGVSMSF